MEKGDSMQLMDISSINTDNEYLRLNTDVSKLKKSIETVGLIHPLVINDKNELISGGRRYTALKELGFSEIPVILVEKTALEQELISIDENLVRKDLTNIEFEKSLSRGKEIYEMLYPNATKFVEEDLATPEQNEIQFDTPNDQRSFIDLTAEKTGLSKKVIKSAIERDEKASDLVKELRSHGELNASQTNELIKLSKDEQQQVADLVKDKSAKEVKELVKNAQKKGFNEAMDEFVNAPNLPKEYASLKTLLMRTNKILAKILLEEMQTSHDDVHRILDLISTTRISMDQFIELCAKEPSSDEVSVIDTQSIADESQDDYNYGELVADAMNDFQNENSHPEM